MKKRVLGKTGIEVSEIAFGGVEIGVPYGIGVHSMTDMLSRDKAISLLHDALDKGINFFDTARLYGESESIMGEAFHDRRDKVVIATKCNHFKDTDGQIPPYPILKTRIETSLNESLEQLRTDNVDVFMLHQADLGILTNTDVKAIFDKLKHDGKVRAIGASTYTADETKSAIDKGWDVIQLPFNLLDQQQASNFDYAEEQGTGLVVRSVLMKGLLSNKGRNLHAALHAVEEHITKYKVLLTDDISEISTLAKKFALSFKQVSSVLVGIDSSEYLYKAVQSVDGAFLSETDVLKAQKLAYPDPGFLDLTKWDRMGWLT